MAYNVFVFVVEYHSNHLAHMPLQGYSSQNSIYFLLIPFCIKLVTIYLIACKFAVMYLYKDNKYKPKIRIVYKNNVSSV